MCVGGERERERERECVCVCVCARARVYLPLRICIKGWKNSFWMDAGDEMHFDEWMVRGDMIAVTPQNI